MSTKKPHIKLHGKYGLNHTIALCFWCGEESGTIALLGASYNQQAPRTMFINYDPCDKCAERMTRGIQLVEFTNTPVVPAQIPLMKDVWPTGRWLVLKPDSFARIFRIESDPELYERIVKSRFGLVQPELFEKFMEHAPPSDPNSLANMEPQGHA
jgi:hypothetical protein